MWPCRRLELTGEDDCGMKWPRMRLKKELGQSMLRVKDIEIMLECGGEKVWQSLCSLLWEILSILISSLLTWLLPRKKTKSSPFFPPHVIFFYVKNL